MPAGPGCPGIPPRAACSCSPLRRPPNSGVSFHTHVTIQLPNSNLKSVACVSINPATFSSVPDRPARMGRTPDWCISKFLRLWRAFRSHSPRARRDDRGRIQHCSRADWLVTQHVGTTARHGQRPRGAALVIGSERYPASNRLVAVVSRACARGFAATCGLAGWRHAWRTRFENYTDRLRTSS